MFPYQCYVRFRLVTSFWDLCEKVRSTMLACPVSLCHISVFRFLFFVFFCLSVSFKFIFSSFPLISGDMGGRTRTRLGRTSYSRLLLAPLSIVHFLSRLSPEVRSAWKRQVHLFVPFIDGSWLLKMKSSCSIWTRPVSLDSDESIYARGCQTASCLTCSKQDSKHSLNPPPTS